MYLCFLAPPRLHGVLPVFHPSLKHPLTRNQSQRLHLPEETGTTTPHRFLPFRFPVNIPLLQKRTPDFNSILIRAPRKKQNKKHRGNHETPGQSTYGYFDSDITDVDVVVKYLKSKYGYDVTTIVSHSKAAMVTMRYLCTYREVAANVRCFVNVAGRYRMVSPAL